MEAQAVLLLALVASALAGPIAIQESDTCSEGCIPNNKFTYSPGTTYIYNYRADTETTVAGAAEDKSSLTLTATARLQARSPCDYSLKMTNTRLMAARPGGRAEEADSDSTFRNGVEGFELRFSMQDGHVTAVCPPAGAPAWAVNVHKGLLSALSNAATDLTTDQNVTETDVAGTCKTEYKLQNDGWSSVEVKKVKDILSCTGRNSLDTALHMVPYTLPSELQALPILKTTHECVHEVNKGAQMNKATCEETHVFRPFSNGNSGAATTVRQELQLQTSEYERPSAGKVSQRDSLQFEQAADVTPEQAKQALMDVLAAVCQASAASDARPTSPALFARLVSAMKSVQSRDLQMQYRQLEAGRVCGQASDDMAKKYFQDALAYAGTEGSLQLMVTLVTAGRLPMPQARAWVATLALKQNPTAQMLIDAKALLDNEATRDMATLPVAALVHQYCKSRSCQGDLAAAAVSAVFERDIGSRCNANDRNRDKIVLALRALGNAGTDAAIAATRCMQNEQNPMEVRVAAAQAFRRMTCDVKDNGLWKTFEDLNESSELRLSAYLALLRCPSEATLKRAAKSLEKEKQPQVGAFVKSHLENLGKSSDPHKQDVAKIARGLNCGELGKDFDLSFTAASRSFEMSALINKLNMGFAGEADLIWDSETDLPTAAQANLTVAMFGQAVNLVDFGGRVQGVAKWLKKALGDSWLPEKAKNKINEEMSGSFYTRIFGNEIFYWSSESAAAPAPSEAEQTWMDAVVMLAKKNAYSLQHSAQLMDLSLTVPTAAGFPLRLDVNATATAHLKMEGKFDMRKIYPAPHSMDIDGEISPSAAVEVTGTMAVDARVARSGLRMRNLLHTSTQLKGQIRLDRSMNLKVNLDTPNEKMEIFSANSKFFLLHNNEEHEQKMVEKNRQSFQICTGDKAANIFGMELCGDISFANASEAASAPYFPLTGPTSASLALHKRDSHDSYKLMVALQNTKKSSIAQLSFDTPNSRVNRFVSLEANVNYESLQLAASLRSPWKTAALDGNVINNDKMLSFSSKVKIDDKDEYAFASEVKIDKSKTGFKFTPMVELRRPGAKNIQLSGDASVMTPFKAVDFNLELTGLSAQPYRIAASVKNTKKERSASGSFSMAGAAPWRFALSHAFAVMGKKEMTGATLQHQAMLASPDRELFNLDSNIMYKADKQLKLNTTINAYRLLRSPAKILMEAKKTPKKKVTRYDIDVDVKSPRFSARLDQIINLKKDNTMLASSTMIVYNIPKVAKNKIVFKAKATDKSTKTFKKINSKIAFINQKASDYNFDLKSEFSHKKRNTGVNFALKYGKNYKNKDKTMTLAATLVRKLVSLKAAVVNLKAQATAPEYKINWNLNGKHAHNKKALDTTINLNLGGKDKVLSGEMMFRDKSAKDIMKYNGKMAVSGFGTDYIVQSSLDQNNANKYTHNMVIKGPNKMKHNINTVYQSKNGHNVVSKVTSNSFKPITLSGSTNLVFTPKKFDPKNMDISADVKHGKDAYGMRANTKLSSAQGKLDMELYYPSRRTALLVEGAERKGKYSGKIDAAWNVDKDKDAKIVLDGNVYTKKARNAVSTGGALAFSSPFKGFEDISTSFTYGDDEKQHDMSAELSLNGKKMSTFFQINKPISFKNFKMAANLKTPYKGYSVISFDVDHKINPNMMTVIEGKFDKESGKIVITGVNNGDLYNRDFQVTVNGQSSTAVARKFDIAVEHKDGNGKVYSKGSMMINNDPYMYEITGSHDLQRRGSIEGKVKVETPFRKAMSTELYFKHNHGRNMLKNNAYLKINDKEKASHSLIFNGLPSAFDIDFSMASPFHPDIRSKINAKYARFPFTGVADLTVGPKQKYNMEGSISLPAWNMAEAELKVYTPFKDFRNLLFKASNKEDRDGVIISNMNLDFGVRKDFDIENRFVFNNQRQMLRLKMRAPFQDFKTLDTGFDFNGHLEKFNGFADFAMTPLTGKYIGNLDWQLMNDEFVGNLRIDTPHTEFPFLYIASTSSMKRGERRSSLSIKYDPNKEIRLDSSFALRNNLLDMDITLRSPFRKFNNIGGSFMYSLNENDFTSNAVVTYQPRKKIETDVSLNWRQDIHASFNIKTPFEDFESSKVVMHHTGDKNNFQTHVEAMAAGKTIQSDFVFKGGFSAGIDFTVNTNFEGFEKFEMAFNKQGNMDNFNANAMIALNDEKADAMATFQKSRSQVKATFNMNAPYLQNINFNFNHQGDMKSFSNKIVAKYGNFFDFDSNINFVFRLPDISLDSIVKVTFETRQEVFGLNFLKKGPIDDLEISANANYNRDSVRMNGSWKLLRNGIQASMSANTPFDNFKRLAMSLNHVGDILNFKTGSSITYMDDKTISGNVALTSNGFEFINFNIGFNTPFSSARQTQVSFKHSFDPRSFDTKGDASLTTTIGRFGKALVKYNKKGDMNDFNANIEGEYNNDKAELMFLKKGPLTDLTVKGKAALNNDEISLEGKRCYFCKTDKDVEAEVNIKTPFEVLKNIGAFAVFSGDASEFRTNARLNYNMKDVINVDLSNKLDTERVVLKSDLTVQTDWTPKIELSIDHQGMYMDFNSRVEGMIGSRNKMSAATSMTSEEDTINGQVQFNYDTQDFGSNQGFLSFRKAGKSNDFTFVASGDLNGKKGSINGVYNAQGDYSGSVTVRTPFEGYKTLGAGFKVGGRPTNFKTDWEVTIADGQRYALKFNFYKYQMSRMEVIMELSTPISGYKFNKFEYRHEGAAGKLNCYATVEYGNSKKIDGVLKIESEPVMTFNLGLTTPFENYENLLASATLRQNLPEFAQLDGSLNAGNGMEFSLNGKFDGRRAYTGSLNVKTPFNDFRDLKMSFNHMGNMETFRSNGKVNYMDGKEISASLDVQRMGQNINAEVKTPFEGYESAKFSHNQNINNAQAVFSDKIVFGKDAQEITSNIRIIMSPNYSMRTTIKTPFNGYENMEASYLLNLKNPYKAEATLKLWPEMMVEFKSSLDINDIRGMASLKAPIPGHEEITFSFGHIGDFDKFESEAKVMYAKGKEINGKVSFNMDKRGIFADFDLTTPFKKFEKTVLDINIKKRGKGYAANIIGQFMKKKAVLNGKFSLGPRYDFNIVLKSPFKVLRIIKANGNMDLKAPKYGFNGYMMYNNKKTEFKTSGTLNGLNPQNIDASFEIDTPFDDFKMFKAEYDHDIDDTTAKGKSSFMINNKKMFSHDVQATIEPKVDARLTIMTAAKDFDKIELALTHDGEIKNFKSTGFFSSPLTGDARAQANFNFKTVMDMELSASLKSEIPNADSMNMKVKTSGNSNSKKIDLEAGWMENKMIKANGEYKLPQSWNDDTHEVLASLTTPFSSLRQAKADAQLSLGRKSARINVEHNRQAVLDMDSEYSETDRHFARLTMRTPRAMELTVAAKPYTDLEINANWDQTRDGSVRLVGSLKDMDVTLSLEHAGKRYGLKHDIDMSGRQRLATGGNLYWGNANNEQVSYNLMLEQSSRRGRDISEGNLKMGLPMRTLELSGSLISAGATHSLDGAFKWDVTKDQNQMIGVKANLRQGSPMQGDLTISMPSLNKMIKFDGQMLHNNGPIMLDMRTDFSYSTDASRTLSVFSKLIDNSRGDVNNYTLEMGVEHPATKINMQMRSSLGFSKDRLTGGFEGSYQPHARRQMARLHLLGEIDMLKRELNAQMLLPYSINYVNSMVQAEPTHWTSKLELQGEELFSTDLMIDSKAMNGKFDYKMGGKRMSVVAEYPSKKEFRAYLETATPALTRKEVELDVFLNSSCLLHSRLAWQPHLLGQLSQSMDAANAAAQVALLNNWAVIKQDLTQEISAKYLAVATEVRDELMPLVEAAMQAVELPRRDAMQLEMDAKTGNLWAAVRVWMPKALEDVRNCLNDMQSYPIGRRVDELVGDSVQSAILSLLRWRGSFSAGLAAVDEAVTDVVAAGTVLAQAAIDSVKDGKYFKMVQEKLEELKVKIEELKAAIMEPIKEVHGWGMPRKLQEIIDVCQAIINKHANELWSRPELSSVRDAVNRVYQQLKWAREYWQVEQQLLEKLEAAAMYAYDVIKDELMQLQKRSSEFNPITYYNPAQGEIQLCLPLPLAMESLQELPDTAPLVEDINELLHKIKQYLPDQEEEMDKAKKAVMKALAAVPQPPRGPPRRAIQPPRGSRGNPSRRQPPADYRPRRYYRNRNRGRN